MKKGVIVVKSNIDNYCVKFDMAVSCSIVDCFGCGHADYCVLDENNEIVKPFREKNFLFKKTITTKYLVEFKEDIEPSKLYSYLKNKNSDYCLIKIVKNGLTNKLEVVKRFKEQPNEEKEKQLTKQLA